MIGVFARNTSGLPTMMLRRLVNVRFLSQTNRQQIEKKSESSTPPSQSPSTETTSPSSSAQPWQRSTSSGYKPTNFDKRVLVWSGKYKNSNDVPETVS